MSEDTTMASDAELAPDTIDWVGDGHGPTLTEQKQLTLRVDAVRMVAATIRQVELVSADGSALPAFTAGSHINLKLPGELSRSYSLTNGPETRDRYVIGVNRDAASRGGSAYIVDALKVGDVLPVDPPHNTFHLIEDAEQSAFFAGGISGNVIGYFWQPYGAGNSIAFYGLLGLLAAWLLSHPVRNARVRDEGRLRQVERPLDRNRNSEGAVLDSGAWRTQARRARQEHKTPISDLGDRGECQTVVGHRDHRGDDDQHDTDRGAQPVGESEQPHCRCCRQSDGADRPQPLPDHIGPSARGDPPCRAQQLSDGHQRACRCRRPPPITHQPHQGEGPDQALGHDQQDGHGVDAPQHV